MKTSIDHCSIKNFERSHMDDILISKYENDSNAPFNVKRIFYSYNVPKGIIRGEHAHRICHQLIIAVSGSFDVEVFDGRENKIFRLNTPDQALHVVPKIWVVQKEFSNSAISLVLASELYDENEYIRSYSEFCNIKNVDEL